MLQGPALLRNKTLAVFSTGLVPNINLEYVHLITEFYWRKESPLTKLSPSRIYDREDVENVNQHLINGTRNQLNDSFKTIYVTGIDRRIWFQNQKMLSRWNNPHDFQAEKYAIYGVIFEQKFISCWKINRLPKICAQSHSTLSYYANATIICTFYSLAIW